MSIFNQMKLAQDMMKNMSPDQMREIMKQAQDSQQQLREQISQVVTEEIQKRNLVTHEELEKMLTEYKK